MAAMFPSLQIRKLAGARQRLGFYDLKDRTSEGPEYLEDIWVLEAKFGLDYTYSYNRDFFTFELYNIFWEESLRTITFALATVVLIVLILTANVQVTFFVVSSLIFVCVSTLGVAYYLGMTFNSVLGLNLSLSLGIAVDYSVHIANSYLNVRVPVSLKGHPQAQREYKAREAISRMGPSVLHGGISTLISVSMLGFADLITFTIFFNCWMTFVTIGIINGILLLPALLSMWGPLDPETDVSSISQVGLQN